MAGLLIRRLFDTFPRSTEIFDGLAVRSSEEIIRVLQNTSSNVPSLLFVVPTLSVGRRFSKSICLSRKSQELGLAERKVYESEHCPPAKAQSTSGGEVTVHHKFGGPAKRMTR